MCESYSFCYDQNKAGKDRESRKMFNSIFLFLKSMDMVMLPFLIRMKTVRNSREINAVKTINSVSMG